jgi:hypothetical protein
MVKSTAHLALTLIMILTTLGFDHVAVARQGLLSQDQRFLLAVRAFAVKNSVKISRIEAETSEELSNALTQSSWRVTATGEAPNIIQWSNHLSRDFQSCGMRQLEFKRAGANVKDFDATMTWLCFELKDK